MNLLTFETVKKQRVIMLMSDFKCMYSSATQDNWTLETNTGESRAINFENKESIYRQLLQANSLEITSIEYC